MPLVVKRIDTGQILYRSMPDFLPRMGVTNASLIYGIDPSLLEETTVTNAEWDSYVRAFPAYRMASDIGLSLPTWEQVQTAIQNASTLADFRVIILKMARVLYWLAKRQET